MKYEAWLENKIKAVIENDLTIENAVEYLKQLAVYSGRPAKPNHFIEDEIRRMKDAVRWKEKG
jgi:hypothetical protein